MRFEEAVSLEDEAAYDSAILDDWCKFTTLLRTQRRDLVHLYENKLKLPFGERYF